MGSVSEALRPAPYGPAIHLPAPYPEKTEFPLSLAASHPNTHIAALVAEVEELSSSGKLRGLLDKHGAVYFQNLGLESAEQFSQFAHAFGWTAHEDIGNPVRRTIHAKNVATANEGPNTQPVYPHNEFGLSPHFPAYVFFYCASAPETGMYELGSPCYFVGLGSNNVGGETPINNSVVLYRRLRERHPDFIDEIEKKGVKYQLFYPNGPRDQTSSAGTTLLQAYGRNVSDSDDTETARVKIETEVKRLATAQWVWENQSDSNPLGDLRVWQHLPAVRNHPRTGDTAFFNNVVSRFLNAIDADTLQPPHINKDGKYQPPAFYGDGSLIPREFLDSAVEIIKSVISLWLRRRLNHAVQHGREPWTGDRRLLASLWDESSGQTH
ncbi:Putative TauD/TfdA-like domain, taurine dioxygenase TauD-like superfamily [Colletotrichum destructivum]|uniref:TauD/TfdA-like domain, taurine dioxygenase TauD-like superfamily n=1 Tax=Colletotrichum destructivum TaxID=34406 RepID=A0AAX4IMM0_9PEZI|nr:Putative TauD/TfdA-like domain, taurine dioxygenase TauD-like superfamily [Colletotrichum destructivum]